MEKTYSRFGIAVFTITLLWQGGHYIEHLAQMYQHVFLRWPIKESHGLLFFADLEWNHFLFNFSYFLLLVTIFISLRFFDRSMFASVAQWPRYLFLLGFSFQGYHVLEHAARIGQHLQTGCSPCPGFLGWYFNGIYLHFVYNSTVLILPACAFFAYGFHKIVIAYFQKARNKTA